MDRLCIVLLICAMIFGTVGVAETSMQTIELGQYTYQVPIDWDTDLDDDGGFNYHYETGDPFTGVYLTTVANEVPSAPDYAESVLDEFIEGLSGSEECEKCEIVEPFECAGIGDLPRRCVRVEYDFVFFKLPAWCMIWTDYTNIYTISVSNALKEGEARGQLEEILASVKVKDAPKPANSRKNPAAVGEAVSITVERNGLVYTMEAVVDEFYRGEDYDKISGKYTQTPAPGHEYVAVKMTITFKSIESIQPAILGTDDPEISVDAIFNFDTYTSTGSEYDNVHYSISDQKELSDVYEGASTTGYFQFEIEKEDPAPLLAYEPEYKQKAWFSLK